MPKPCKISQMPKIKSTTENFVSPFELRQRSTKTLVLSSRQLNWKGILVEQCQYSPSPNEATSPALTDHRLILPLGSPAPLIQKRDNRSHQSILQKGDSIFVPAGYPSAWRSPVRDTNRPQTQQLHVWLKPELLKQAAEASELDVDQLDLVNCFGKQDSQLHHIAMLLLAELQSDSVMGQLYVESLTQVLAIHLLRHYSTFTQPITFENRNLTHTRLQEAIEYILTHLDRDLSLVEIAGIINISPTYFASLFKRATGISPHQYVIQQRLERAKLMLLKTDLAISDIALRVGFSNQSHLTRHFKNLFGVTPKQVR
jgi:AraC family transcriptional regulator